MQGWLQEKQVSSPASPVASPAPQTNPLSSLVNLLPFEPDSKLLSLAEVDLAVAR